MLLKKKKQRKKEKGQLCAICHKQLATTTMRDFSGENVIWVCEDCKKNMRI